MANTTNLQNFNYFLKGDISGIQEFIFNVKSEGAAKSLKGRSFFIQALSLICIRMIEDEMKEIFPDKKTELFYNGGGNFYLLLEDYHESIHNRLQKSIDKNCHELDFHIVLSYLTFNDAVKEAGEVNFGKAWEALNAKSGRDKLTKFKAYPEGYAPYPAIDKKEVSAKKDKFLWKKLTNFLDGRQTYTIEPLTNGEKGEITANGKGIKIFGYHLTDGRTESFQNQVLQLPRWDFDLLENNQQLINEETQRRLGSDLEEYEPPHKGGIIEFSFLAGFSKIRTGTKKIGILKMDVDGLGALFGLLDSLNVADKISKTISNFFGEKMSQLLEKTIATKQLGNTPSTFGQNIYTVFAGGDDCFFVGGWDVIMEWATLVQQEFKMVAEELATWIIDLKGKSNTPIALLDLLPTTISGGLVMLEPTYPTIRFSDLANDALDQAKYFTYPREPKRSNTKNKISLLNQVLTWDELGIVRSAAALLERLIKEEGEPKSTVEKIRSTAPEFQDLYKKATKKVIQGPSVAKLFYFTRKSPNQAIISKTFITPFAKDLIGVFALGDHSNPLKYPLAARIAEFYTRKQT